MHAIFAPVITAAALVLAVPAVAQDQQPPARLGNIWNGQDHPLPPGQTRADEKSAGVELNPAQQQRQTDEVEQMEQQLLQGVHQGPGAAP